MKKTFNLLSVLFVIIITSAFTPNSSSSDWTLYKEVNGVKIFTKVNACQLQSTNKSNQYVLFKYVNTTNKNKRISGRVDAYYNNLCRSCNLDSPNEYEFSIDLKAGQSQKGNCSDELKAFKLFYSSQDSRVAPLSKFELSNLNVVDF